MVNNIIATAGLIEVIGLELFWTGTESVREDQDACTSQTFPYRVRDEKMSLCYEVFFKSYAKQVDFKKKALLEWAKPYLARFLMINELIMIPLIKIY